MCARNHQLHLCSCSNFNINTLKHTFSERLKSLSKKEYISIIRWRLFKFVESKWIGLDGMLVQPVSKLTKEVNATFLREHMNERNCFDFDYNPVEGDQVIFDLLLIDRIGRIKKKSSEYKFLSLIYRNQNWTIDNYDNFYDVTVEIKTGITKLKI